MAIGTLFTLFVTPMVYTFLARDHAALIARERAAGHLAPATEPVGAEFMNEPVRTAFASGGARILLDPPFDLSDETFPLLDPCFEPPERRLRQSSGNGDGPSAGPHSGSRVSQITPLFGHELPLEAPTDCEQR